MKLADPATKLQLAGTIHMPQAQPEAALYQLNFGAWKYHGLLAVAVKWRKKCAKHDNFYQQMSARML
jgi:hypothetical protein